MTINDEQEQWDADPNTTIGRCERCGEERPCQWLTDPFVIEGICEDSGPVFWCYECHDERWGDV